MGWCRRSRRGVGSPRAAVAAAAAAAWARKAPLRIALVRHSLGSRYRARTCQSLSPAHHRRKRCPWQIWAPPGSHWSTARSARAVAAVAAVAAAAGEVAAARASRRTSCTSTRRAFRPARETARARAWPCSRLRIGPRRFPPWPTGA
eukprot:scaffold108468_cov63-Phaeocystis_antarctica.AAC.5